MKNSFKKLFAPMAIFTMAIGVAISVNNHSEVGAKAVEALYYTADYSKAAAITAGAFTATYPDEETVTLSDGTLAKEWKSYGANPNNYAVAGTRFGGKNTGLLTDGIANYPSTITVGTGWYLMYITGTAQFGKEVTKIEVNSIGTFGTGSFVVGKKMFLQVSPNADFSSSLELSATMVATGTHTFTAVTPWASSSYYRVVMERNSGTSTSNSGLIISNVKFYAEAPVIPVSSVTITDPTTTNLTVGDVSELSATVLPVDANDKSLTWSSDAPTVAEVDQNGKVTAISAGSATITAKSNNDNTKLDTVSFTVSGVANAYDKTITATSFGMTGTYVDGNYTNASIVYNAYQVMKSTNTTTLNALQFRGSPSGYLFNKTVFPSNIDSVRIKLSSGNTDTTYALYVGTSAQPTSAVTVTGVADSRDSLIIVYDVSALGNYTYFTFTRTATTGTVYLDAITIELVNTDVEAARVYADSLLSTLDSECAASSVSSGTWTTLANSYSALSSAAKAAFTGETSTVAVSRIQQALHRYAYIVNKYGYTNFMGITILGSSPRTITQKSDTNNVVAIVTIGVVALTSLLGYYTFKKKRLLD